MAFGLFKFNFADSSFTFQGGKNGPAANSWVKWAQLIKIWGTKCLNGRDGFSHKNENRKGII